MIKYIVIYYLICSFLLFVIMGFDKQRAIKGQWRIKEATLLVIGVIGGFFGGLLGMKAFHHKTKKLYFWLIYLLSLILHICILMLAYRFILSV